MAPVRIAVIGLGKIARDQHLAAIAANRDTELAATIDLSGEGVGAPHFTSFKQFMSEGPPADAVAICTPPQARGSLAAQALSAGLHVLLEKPPAATLSEAAGLENLAAQSRVTLFTGWHSRYAAGVEPARAWLADRGIQRVDIVWREDVRRWHPGQKWIFEPGGLGVFDPGINALSIATRILPRRIFVTAADLYYPENCATPIAATVVLQDEGGLPVTMDLDFLQSGPQIWNLCVETTGGRCVLTEGGAVLSLPDTLARSKDEEYSRLYTNFVELVRKGKSDIDLTPMRLVADAFLLGRRHSVVPFME